MLEAERRKTGHVLFAYLLAGGTQLLKCGDQVNRVPKDHRVQHQAQGPRRRRRSSVALRLPPLERARQYSFLLPDLDGGLRALGDPESPEDEEG